MQHDNPTSAKPLRVWPGAIAVVLLWIFWFVGPSAAPDSILISLLGGLICAVAVLVWWLFFSRVAWLDRLAALVLIAAGVVATRRIVHPSIAGGAQGMLIYVLAIPAMSLALVAAAAVGRPLTPGRRRAWLIATIALACVAFTLVRTGGVIGGSAWSDLHWRWTPTAEERLLARASDDPSDSARPSVDAARDKPLDSAAAASAVAPPSAPATTEKTPAAPSGGPEAAAAKTPEMRSPAPASEDATSPAHESMRAEWPGFRGPARDGIVRGVQIETDWSHKPPVAIWRRAIGPGWSSFAVQGDLLYTQEQRGDDEIVGCYKVSTGEPVWRHRDRVRFYESNGGAGPRATPTLSRGRVYAFGATGILNALDGRTGRIVWSHNAASDTKVKVPMWGFSSSPVVVDDIVIVAVSGALAAYDANTGDPRWSRASHGGSYSSPHLTTIDGVPQIVLLSAFGATSVAPADGKVLWDYKWPGGTTITQPALTGDGDVIINNLSASGLGSDGTRRIAITHGADGWSAKERWTSTGLKPYFNDFVVHKGHAFGFDGSILACIDLEDGTRKWKGGRYGNGQLVLLPDQDLLLVVSEDGELALVAALPDKFTELARIPAIEGKTWNHPVLVRDILLVRNGEEMAAFRVSLAGH